MSAQPYDTAPEETPQAPPLAAYAPQAQAAVDILPVTGGRKPRQPEAEPEPYPQGVDPTWGAPAPVNPWTGVPSTDPPAAAPGATEVVVAVEPQPTAPVPPPPPAPSAPTHTPLVYAGAIPPPVSVPVFPGGGLPPAVTPAANPTAYDDADGSAPPAKRFLGMQLRRPRRGDAPADGETVELGPEAPVAAWPTDVGLPVVATAEPATPAPWGVPVATAAEALVELPMFLAPADSVPADLPAEPMPVDVTPVEAPVASAVEAPVEAALESPVEAAQAPVEAVAQTPLPLPELVAPPVPVPAADDELRSLRLSAEASDARRTAAEHRADNAVAYAQQLQAELTQVTTDLEGRLQASETRCRTAANEAQDWQIRHREAQAQIAELATSLAGAEQRLAEVRAERDELMVQLEEATEPTRDADEVAAELDA